LISKAILKRYKKHSEEFELEGIRLKKWREVLPVGQHPPSYEKASLKLAYFKRRKITPLWKQIRSRILPNGKTLWQKIPWATEDEPPLFREVEPFIKKRKPKKRGRRR